jgi:putative phosphoribosyl transferase
MRGETKEATVQIPVGKETLEGELSIPADAKGMVLFAHGSGSSRFSPRNQFVARFLQKNRLATLLIDLLTFEEDKIDQLTRELRFNIEMLAGRLSGVTQWLLREKKTAELPIGYFGSSTGAAAALIAAGEDPDAVSAVVSRGGRPDLAGGYLAKVQAPTLLIVGGADTVVIELNEEAYQSLSCVKRLEIVPRATHLFEEPGALEKVAELASNWFVNYL